MSSKKRNASSMASDAAAASDKKAKLSSPALNRTASGTANGTNNNGTRSTAAVALTPAEYSDTAVSHSDKFKVYSASTGDRANLILHTVLPRKVLELDYLVSTTMRAGFQQSIEFPFAADGTFLPGRQTEPIRSNPCIMSLIPQVKAEVLGLIDNIGALRIMIQLKIPPADDAISELSKVEDVAFQYIEKISAYLGNRTRIAAKCMKYAAILDYWQAIRELDNCFHTDLQLQLVEMRNNYATMHDLLLKNEEKIKNPRGEVDGQGKNRHAFA